jgi:hypothetical protein
MPFGIWRCHLIHGAVIFVDGDVFLNYGDGHLHISERKNGKTSFKCFFLQAEFSV